ncbi:MAG: phage holin family protein [Clostridiales bacterium]|nr:phage holin family protein [Candidatus Cacconaster stercorequi]
MEDINILGVSGVAFIVIICLLIGVIVKATSLANKWIPVICGVCGGALGALGMRFGAVGFPATDYFNAVAIGIVSGLGSVGCHEMVKQMTKEDNREDH